VLRGLEPISEVKEAHIVYDVYDIIARLETETMQDMKDNFSMMIRLLNNVRSKLTIIVVELISRDLNVKTSLFN